MSTAMGFGQACCSYRSDSDSTPIIIHCHRHAALQIHSKEYKYLDCKIGIKYGTHVVPNFEHRLLNPAIDVVSTPNDAASPPNLDSKLLQ
jgi:hypothetical protein